MREEQAQQFEFLVCQRDVLSIRRDGVALFVEHQTAAAQLGCRLRATAAQHRFDTGDELHHAEWLC